MESNYCLLISSIVLFHIGMLGLVLNRDNILKTIMSLEILLLSVNLSFITFSLYLDDIVGQIFVLFILTLSATESSIGLSILAVYYDHKNNISLDPIKIRSKSLKLRKCSLIWLKRRPVTLESVGSSPIFFETKHL
jgi:NADH-quinone oxidoreductase subunit K